MQDEQRDKIHALHFGAFRAYRGACGGVDMSKDWREELQQQLDINNAQRALSVVRIGDAVSERQIQQEWVGRPREITRGEK